MAKELVNQEGEKVSEWNASGTNYGGFNGWNSRINCFLWFCLILTLLGFIFAVFYMYTNVISIF